MDDLRLNADVESACDADTGTRFEVDVDGVSETTVARQFRSHLRSSDIADLLYD